MNLRELVDKAMDDREFYEQLKRDPERALQQQGVKPSSEQIEALKKLNYEYLEEVAEAFGPQTLVT
jgi:phosphohistidine phosphatase SixA